MDEAFDRHIKNFKGKTIRNDLPFMNGFLTNNFYNREEHDNIRLNMTELFHKKMIEGKLTPKYGTEEYKVN